MSCIGQILESTNHKPHVISICQGQLCIEGGGIYKNYEYLITMNDLGFRCGYIAIKGNEPWAHKCYDEIPVECHGGLTFFDDHKTIKSQFNITCPDKWLGFDAGHWMDAKDWEATKRYNMITILTRLKKAKEENHELKMIKEFEESMEIGTGAVIRDFSYIQNECKSIIDQIVSFNKEII